jgi:MraZ protein
VSSFKGSYLYAVDEKGRVSVPAKLRKCVSPESNETFVITRGFEQCLFVYPLDEWNKLEEKLRVLSAYNPEHRIFIRTLLELAIESQLDTQSRLSIPQELREYAGIKGEVRILGMLDKIELWEPKVYETYKASLPESYESIAARVMR